jgi:hypothetical protein
VWGKPALSCDIEMGCKRPKAVIRLAYYKCGIVSPKPPFMRSVLTLKINGGNSEQTANSPRHLPAKLQNLRGINDQQTYEQMK